MGGLHIIALGKKAGSVWQSWPHATLAYYLCQGATKTGKPRSLAEAEGVSDIEELDAILDRAVKLKLKEFLKGGVQGVPRRRRGQQRTFSPDYRKVKKMLRLE